MVEVDEIGKIFVLDPREDVATVAEIIMARMVAGRTPNTKDFNVFWSSVTESAGRESLPLPMCCVHQARIDGVTYRAEFFRDCVVIDTLH